MGRRRDRLLLDRDTQYRGLYGRSAGKSQDAQSEPLSGLALCYETLSGLFTETDTTGRTFRRRAYKGKDAALGTGRGRKRKSRRVANVRAGGLHHDRSRCAEHNAKDLRRKLSARLS